MSREGVFWGWGEPGAGPSLPDHAAGFLRSALGVEGAVVSRAGRARGVRLAPPALPGAARERLAAIVGEAHVRDDAPRAPAAAAASPTSTCCASARATARTRPTPWWRRATRARAQQVIYACSEEGVAVVPYGGGTSVVGGLEPLRGRYGALISLDLGRLEGLLSFDERSYTAWLGGRDAAAGGRPRARRARLHARPHAAELRVGDGRRLRRHALGGPVLDRARADRGQRRGAALRDAGGELATLAVPATAAGPSLEQLVIGSEGTLGVITSVGLRVFPRPAAQRYEGWFVRSFAEGADALRRLVQAGIEPDVARLSDEAETRMALALGGGGGLKGQAGRALLRARGYADGCLLICGWEDDADAIARRRSPAARALRAGGRACRSARAPGRAWLAGRYAGPHLRDDLLDRGVLVETLETATSWSNLEALRAAVTRALEGARRRRSWSATSPTSTRRRLAVLHGARGAGPRRSVRSVARGEGGRRRTRSSRPAGRSRTTTRSARDHAPWLPRGGRARWGTMCCGRSRSAATRRGS